METMYRTFYLTCILFFCNACHKDETPPYFVEAFDREKCFVTLSGDHVQNRKLTNSKVGAKYIMTVPYLSFFDGTVYTRVSYPEEYPLLVTSAEADSVKTDGTTRSLYFTQQVIRNQIHHCNLILEITRELDLSKIGLYNMQANSKMVSSQWNYTAVGIDSIAKYESRRVNVSLQEYLQIYVSDSDYISQRAYQIQPTKK